MKQIMQFSKQLFLRRQAQKHSKEWGKRVKPVNQLSKEDREIWYEGQEELWKSWYGQ